MNQPIRFLPAFFSSFSLLIFGVIVAFLCNAFLSDFSLTFTFSFVSLCQGFVLGLTMFALVFVGMRFFEPVTPALKTITLGLNRLFSEFTWPMIIVISCMAGVGEELLFRGVIQSTLVNVTNPLMAIVISSMVFAALHCMTKLYVLLAFLASLMIGSVFHLTQNLVTVMVLHSVYDVLAFAWVVKYFARFDR